MLIWFDAVQVLFEKFDEKKSSKIKNYLTVTSLRS
jgi:hypothetical protein